MKELFGIGVFLGIIAFWFALVVLKVWLIGSLITSAIKAGSDSCGATYGIESVGFSGNWFCPSK